MQIGEKTRLWIPEELAYKGQKGRPAGMLVFDVELLEIQKPIPAPADVAAAPADAKKTASGLAYKVTEAGKGGDKPAAGDKITVHITGWKKDGEMIFSSVQDKRPQNFDVGTPRGVWSKGLDEGIQQLSVGGKGLFWIPEELAYKGMRGAPEGDVVFEMELMELKKAIPAPSDVAAPPADAKKTATGFSNRMYNTSAIASAVDSVAPRLIRRLF